MTPMTRPTTRSAITKKLKAQTTLLKESRGAIGERQGCYRKEQIKTKVLHEEAIKSKEVEIILQELEEPKPKPKLESYYKFVKAGRFIPEKFAVPLLFKLEKEGKNSQRDADCKIKEGRGFGTTTPSLLIKLVLGS